VEKNLALIKEGNILPIISQFFGIKITMYWEDHVPPHFHAEYGEHKIIVDILNGTTIKGVFPFKQLKLVLAWCEIHRDELMSNWEYSQEYKELMKINPLR
jgi:hypothetical protein